MGIRIAGLGKAVPDKVLTNDEMSQMVDTTSEWIESRTGIQRRHVAVTETTESLATQAASEALESAGMMPSEIDLVIVATVSPDSAMPSTACLVAKNLEILHATCFDITAACSGFITASEVAVSLIQSGQYSSALVIGAEVLSKVVDWEDRGTCILFADGAGAVVYKADEMSQVIAIETGSNPLGAHQITLPVPSSSRHFYEGTKQKQAIQMSGKDVYVFATTKVPESIKAVLESQALKPTDISWYILHQANSRIMDSVAQKLGVDKTCFFKNLSEYGNTSAASIPMALYDARHVLKADDYIVLSGFGAGLTWGTMLIKW